MLPSTTAHVFHHQTQSFFPEAAGDLWERSLSAIESFDQNNSELENLVGRIRIQEEEYVRRNKLVRFALAAALTLLVLGFLVLVIASWSTAHNDDDSNGGGEPGENIPVIHYHPRIRG